MRVVNEKKKAKVQKLRAKGLTIREIAKKVGVSNSTVVNYCANGTAVSTKAKKTLQDMNIAVKKAYAKDASNHLEKQNSFTQMISFKMPVDAEIESLKKENEKLNKLLFTALKKLASLEFGV